MFSLERLKCETLALLKVETTNRMVVDRPRKMEMGLRGFAKKKSKVSTPLRPIAFFANEKWLSEWRICR